MQVVHRNFSLRFFLFFISAGSVIGMFLYSLSVETFHKGINIYLSKSTTNAEGIALPKNLYEALQLAIDEDEVNLPGNFKIDELFGSWENNPGYPIVYVERSYNDHRIRFTQVCSLSVTCLQFNIISIGFQNRFTDSIADGVVHDSLWHIPISYSSKANPTLETKPKFWLSQRKVERTIDEVTPDSFFLVNIKQTGYYRVM
jgi:aminopeptidase N